MFTVASRSQAPATHPRSHAPAWERYNDLVPRSYRNGRRASTVRSHAGAWERGGISPLRLAGRATRYACSALCLAASAPCATPTPQWRSRAAKGKKVKNQKLLCPGEAEAKVEDPEAWLVPAATRRTAVPGTDEPAAATKHAAGAR